MYASRRVPEPLLDEIVEYVPKRRGEVNGEGGKGDEWEGIFERVVGRDDDGHACKLVRALRHGEEVCRAYYGDGDERFRVKEGMWLQLGHMGE